MIGRPSPTSGRQILLVCPCGADSGIFWAYWTAPVDVQLRPYQPILAEHPCARCGRPCGLVPASPDRPPS